MRPADLPPDRSLADSQDAPCKADGRAAGGADGRARPPAELLDNLRLRLRQLADNHPSAVRDQDSARDVPPAPEAPASEPAAHEQAAHDRPQAPAPAGHGDDRGDGGSGEPGDRAGDAPAGQDADAKAPREGSREGSLADLIRALKDDGDALAAMAGAGLPGEMDLFVGRDSRDPYRPWFMSGDSGTPWFAAGEEP